MPDWPTRRALARPFVPEWRNRVAWWCRLDSNQRQRDYESRALPPELRHQRGRERPNPTARPRRVPSAFSSSAFAWRARPAFSCSGCLQKHRSREPPGSVAEFRFPERSDSSDVCCNCIQSHRAACAPQASDIARVSPFPRPTAIQLAAQATPKSREPAGPGGFGVGATDHEAPFQVSARVKYSNEELAS